VRGPLSFLYTVISCEIYLECKKTRLPFPMDRDRNDREKKAAIAASEGVSTGSEIAEFTESVPQDAVQWTSSATPFGVTCFGVAKLVSLIVHFDLE
jgi:hypothetical protein